MKQNTKLKNHLWNLSSYTQQKGQLIMQEFLYGNLEQVLKYAKIKFKDVFLHGYIHKERFFTTRLPIVYTENRHNGADITLIASNGGITLNAVPIQRKGDYGYLDLTLPKKERLLKLARQDKQGRIQSIVYRHRPQLTIDKPKK